MSKIFDVSIAFIVFSASLFAQGAIALAVIAGIAGLSSIFMLIHKIDELKKLADRQIAAVDKLDTLVNRIEDAVKPRED